MMRFDTIEDANAAAEAGDLYCGNVVQIGTDRLQLERLAGDGPEWNALPMSSPLEPGGEPPRLFACRSLHELCRSVCIGVIRIDDRVLLNGVKYTCARVTDDEFALVSDAGVEIVRPLFAPGEGTCKPAPVPAPARRERTLPTDSAERKNVPIAEGVLFYFPAALAEVARVSKRGNDKHNPGDTLHHARGKSMDHEDCVLRHTIDAREATGAARTQELAERAWRALAALQEHCEAEGAPMAPNARNT